jgi:hypothetical protein
MKRIERRARVDAPPEELFAYLSDLANLPEWQSGIVSAEITSGDELGVGTTARVSSRPHGPADRGADDRHRIRATRAPRDPQRGLRREGDRRARPDTG